MTGRPAFEYELPPDLIAQHPAPRRDAARMLVLHRRTGRLEHRTVADLPEYLKKGDVVVVNKTRVIPARLRGIKMPRVGAGLAPAQPGAKVELLLLRDRGDGAWLALAKPAKRLPPGSVIRFPQLRRGRPSGRPVSALVVDRVAEQLAVRFSGASAEHLMERIGEPPLPPYIRRNGGPPSPEDVRRYQTIFAREPGAVAAPTAGLHFTPALLRSLRTQGVSVAGCVLHVGWGTFAPLRDDVVVDPRRGGPCARPSVAPERFRLPRETADAVNRAHEDGRRVLAVGTTVARTLETCAQADGVVRSSEGWTDLTLLPGHEFRAVDALLTNFHLPGTTLLMLVSAFAGRARILSAYREAIRRRYRFYSFGDAMLIL
ncbi:MAG: tRNA preQ1(34) S-adenosylmethionine ribosyltransferase-isomerase QueA [bacterium]